MTAPELPADLPEAWRDLISGLLLLAKGQINDSSDNEQLDVNVLCDSCLPRFSERVVSR